MTITQLGTIHNLRERDFTQISDYTDWILTADDWDLTDEQRQELADDTLDMVIRCYDEALEPYEAYIVRNGDVYQRVSGADLPGCDTDERRDLIARIDSAIAEGMEPLYERATAMERD